jgi:hypothetical protein
MIWLISISIVDLIIPLPILGIVLIYVILQRPPWFEELFFKIYEKKY